MEMKCPNCVDFVLRPKMTKESVEIDTCDKCGGIWFDKGEILYFVKSPKKVEQKLNEAIEHFQFSDKVSPRGNNRMMTIKYGDIELDYCKQSGGLWCDYGELEDLQDNEDKFHLNVMDKPERTTTPDPEIKRDGSKSVIVRSMLAPLPNLFARSLATLAMLYAMLGVILIAAVELGYLGLEVSVGIGISIIILQFIVGPFIMDFSLKWLYNLKWVGVEGLPIHLRDFVKKVCDEHHISEPKFGIINDGAPQAFTYGHTPNNARVVISQGILNLLTDEEVESVVAHELGHAIHWDMFFMTVANIVPYLLYYIYRFLIRSSRGGNKSGGGAAAVAMGAFVLYVISQYVVLWFSRTREYHADRFAGDTTNNPSALASALVKIAYGLAATEDKVEDGKSSAQIQSIGAFGIFNLHSAQSFAVTSYGKDEIDQKSRIKGAMRWDMWNPWAKWYELNSTHPLVAKRLEHLSNQSMHMGQEPFIIFDEVQPESYWDEFGVDFTIYSLPTIAIITTIAAAAMLADLSHGLSNGRVAISGMSFIGMGVIFIGLSLHLRHYFSFRSGSFPAMSVAALLKKVKVSAVRPVPCTISGTIIGKGVPGYVFSEDFILQDETGIIYLDYQQPLAIWEFFFGMLKADRFQGQNVEIEGWYHRAPVPYIKIRTMLCAGKETKSYVPMMYKLTATVMTAIGIFMLFI